MEIEIEGQDFRCRIINRREFPVQLRQVPHDVGSRAQTTAPGWLPGWMVAGYKQVLQGDMDSAIYLDNSATTSVRKEVLEAMLPYLGDNCGNASSIHSFGRSAAEALAISRKQVAQLLNALPEEIYFSPCGTYSNNTAIIGRARFAEANALGKHMITCSIEHPSVLGPAKHLEALGWKLTYLPVSREGLVNPDDLRRAIQDDTSIISIMWANNEIGSLQPIVELAAIALEKDIYFHTDAVQVAGKLPLDLSQVKVSCLSLSGHKFYAPKGIGVLYLRKGVNLMPMVFGGGQEHALFPGTEALPNIVAIGKAAELAFTELPANTLHLRKMQEILSKSLLSLAGLHMTGPLDPEQRLPGHVSVIVPGCDGEALVMMSDLKGICISSGSACHQSIKSPSSVLIAAGVDAGDALGSARISAGIFNTEDQCVSAGLILAELFGNSSRQAMRALAGH